MHFKDIKKALQHVDNAIEHGKQGIGHTIEHAAGDISHAAGQAADKGKPTAEKIGHGVDKISPHKPETKPVAAEPTKIDEIAAHASTMQVDTAHTDQNPNAAVAQPAAAKPQQPQNTIVTPPAAAKPKPPQTTVADPNAAAKPQAATANATPSPGSQFLESLKDPNNQFSPFLNKYMPGLMAQIKAGDKIDTTTLAAQAGGIGPILRDAVASALRFHDEGKNFYATDPSKRMEPPYSRSIVAANAEVGKPSTETTFDPNAPKAPAMVPGPVATPNLPQPGMNAR